MVGQKHNLQKMLCLCVGVRSFHALVMRATASKGEVVEPCVVMKGVLAVAPISMSNQLVLVRKGLGLVVSP